MFVWHLFNFGIILFLLVLSQKLFLEKPFTFVFLKMQHFDATALPGDVYIVCIGSSMRYFDSGASRNTLWPFVN